MAGAAEPLAHAQRLAPVSSVNPRPRLSALALALAATVSALLLHALLWGAQAPLGRAPVSGNVIAVGGATWALWATWLVRRAQPPRLLDEGPYRFGRNPVYLGITLLLVGAALALGVPLLVAAAAVFVATVQRLHIPLEEAALRRAFGGWYSDYRASVRRWL